MTYTQKKHSWTDPRVASEYDRRRFATGLQRRKHARDVALVLAHLDRAGPVSTVLDVPSGTGRLVPALRDAGYRVVRLDLSAPMLVAGHARAAGGGPGGVHEGDGTGPTGLGAVRADAEHLPLGDDAIDAAVCVRFLHHVDDARARSRILAEMARVARRAVVAQVRIRASAKQAARFVRHRAGLCRRWSPAPGPGELEAELEAAGLELVELRPVSRLFSDKAFLLARPR